MGVPKPHKEAAAKQTHGANLLRSLAREKHEAALTPPGRDASRENADRARATWRDGASDRKS